MKFKVGDKVRIQYSYRGLGASPHSGQINEVVSMWAEIDYRKNYDRGGHSRIVYLVGLTEPAYVGSACVSTFVVDESDLCPLEVQWEEVLTDSTKECKIENGKILGRKKS